MTTKFFLQKKIPEKIKIKNVHYWKINTVIPQSESKIF